MSNDNKTIVIKKFGKKQKITFALSYLPAWLVAGIFQIWVFTFYFSAIGLPIHYIMAAFIIWSFWNAINDPMIGFLSDRTSTRLGRRKPYIIIGIIPLIVILIITWIPPVKDPFICFVYLLIILFAYDTFETMIFVPIGCLFPELYTSVEERAEVNALAQILSVIGLICAFIIPGFLIGEISSTEGYFINGIVTSIIVGITLLISLIWGITEREEFKQDSYHDFSFLQGIKFTFKNRTFVLYIILFLAFEYIQLVQGTIVPQFTKHVLGEEGSLEAGIMLGVMFSVGIASIILWKKLDLKIGSRFSFFIAIIVYFFALLPMLFVTNYIEGIIVVALMGVGFGGLLYFSFLIIADIIDEDELNTGVRREGTYIGITLFFMRLAGVFSILTISLVFTTTGWETYDPNPNIDVIFGLRMLMVLFPAIALGIMIICLYFYPFTKTRVMELKEKLSVLHQKKRERVAKESDK